MAYAMLKYNVKSIVTSIVDKHQVEQLIKYFAENKETLGIRNTITCALNIYSKRGNPEQVYLMRRSKNIFKAEKNLDIVKFFTITNSILNMIDCRKCKGDGSKWIQDKYISSSSKSGSTLGFVTMNYKHIVIHLLDQSIVAIIESKKKVDELAKVVENNKGYETVSLSQIPKLDVTKCFARNSDDEQFIKLGSKMKLLANVSKSAIQQVLKDLSEKKPSDGDDDDDADNIISPGSKNCEVQHSYNNTNDDNDWHFYEDSEDVLGFESWLFSQDCDQVRGQNSM